MGLYDRVERRASIENPSTSLANPDAWLVQAWGGGDTAAGITVNQQTALRFSAVWACVNVLAQDVAKLPLITYESLERGKRKAPEHPVSRVLKVQANPHMTAYDLRSTMQAHVVTWGKAFAEVERDMAGRVVALWPLLPDRTDVVRRGGEKIVVTRVGSNEIALPASSVLTINGLGFDGIRGYSVIGLARQAIGAGMAAERYGARFFDSGARPSGIIKRKDSLTEQGQQRIRSSWEKVHGGLTGAQRVAILDEGMDYQQIGVPPEDAQFLQTRQFAVEDVARWFRVPPHKIQHLLRSTFSNEENQERSYIRDALQAWLVNWEQQINSTLLGDGYFAKHSVEALLRGDSAARSAFYQSGINNGWLSPNDVREFEDLNPIDGGDVYLVPLNLSPIDQIGQQFALPAPADDDDDDMRWQAERPAVSRERRSLNARKLLQEAQRSTIQTVAERLVADEVREIRRIADDTLDGKRARADFVSDLGKFYERFEQTVHDAFAPIVQAYGASVLRVITDEMGIATIPDTSFDEFVKSYAERMARRHTSFGYKSLKKLVESQAADLQADAINGRLDAWMSGDPATGGPSRAEKIAVVESTRGMGALSRAAYIGAGVLSLVWRTAGDNCPYCRKLDGKVISVQQPFVSKGDTLTTDGDEPDFEVTTYMGHPPLHAGCDCLIAPGAF